MSPHNSCAKGDIVFVRATVVEACSDAFQVRFEDYPTLVVTTWVPAREVALAADVDKLPPLRNCDLRYVEEEGQ